MALLLLSNSFYFDWNLDRVAGLRETVLPSSWLVERYEEMEGGFLTLSFQTVNGSGGHFVETGKERKHTGGGGFVRAE